MNETTLYWYWLYNIEGIGMTSIRKLLQVYGTPKVIFESVKQSDLDNLCIPKKGMGHLIADRDLRKAEYAVERLKRQGIRCLTIDEEDYPQRLKNIFDPPGLLYLRGKLPNADQPVIAIVGARDCTNYGRELALYFGKELSKQGVQIISGLARGIDRYAQEGAVHEKGSTYAVMGCGIDICYPKENIELYMDILKYGGIISEYNVGFQPIKANFPMRNRIISGLSNGILLIEARAKSGSLITMDMGLEQGKNIYACPGRISDALSVGTNHVIQQGGKLVISPKDILEDLNLNCVNDTINSKKNDYLLETQEKIVYDSLSLMPKHMEEIVNELEMPIDEVSAILFQLQLKGCIRQTSGNYFAKKMEANQ